MKMTKEQLDKLRSWQHLACPGGVLYIDSAAENLHRKGTTTAIVFNAFGMSEFATILRDGEQEAL